MRKTMVFLVCVLVLSLWVSPLSAEQRASEDFEGILYEGDVLPSAATPVWDVVLQDQTNHASIVDGKLVVDTLAGGVVTWVLPGPYGAEYFSMPHNYPAYLEEGWENNPWKGFNGIETGYTIEMSVEVVDAVDGTWGFTFYPAESNHGAQYDVQLFENRIHSGGLPEDGSTTRMYSGALTGGQHLLRFVRIADGPMDDPFANPQIQLWVDGVWAYTGGRHLGYTYDNNILIGSAWNQDWLYLGSLSGSAKYRVKIDYIRMDFTGSYEPFGPPPPCGYYGYPIADFNKDCVVDITDLRAMAQGWLMCTDPTDVSCIDCTDPLNAEDCL